MSVVQRLKWVDKCIIVYTKIQDDGILMEVRPKAKRWVENASFWKIAQELESLNEKLETLIEINKEILKSNQKANIHPISIKESALTPDTLSILSLPMSLRKTIMALYRLEKATADDLAKETQRLRAVESASANELVRLGMVGKKREGRDVFFYITENEGDSTANG